MSFHFNQPHEYYILMFIMLLYNFATLSISIIKKAMQRPHRKKKKPILINPCTHEETFNGKPVVSFLYDCQMRVK